MTRISEVVVSLWLLLHFFGNSNGFPIQFTISSPVKPINRQTPTPTNPATTRTTILLQGGSPSLSTTSPPPSEAAAAAAAAALKEDLEAKAFAEGEKFLPTKSCFDGDNVLRNFSAGSIDEKDRIQANSPHLTYTKYLSMQEKRVVVSFRFTDLPYLRPYFLTFCSKLKTLTPDIIVERRCLPVVDATTGSQPIFEVLVDEKLVIGAGGTRERHVLGGRVDVDDTQSVYVSMQQLSLAIARARRKRRPTAKVYDGENNDDEDDEDETHRSYILRTSSNSS